MRSTRLVSVTLPDEQLAELDSFAASDRRSRSSAVAIAVDEFLARQRVAGQQRLAEFERLAAAGVARATTPSPANQAGAEHLRRHAELCGFPPPSSGEDPKS